MSLPRDEHSLFQLLTDSLETARAAALGLHPLRPDQPWDLIAANFWALREQVFKLVESGVVRTKQ